MTALIRSVTGQITDGHMVTAALTIAGSDSGGGAGIQADLKTFSAFGVFGCSAITAITAQNTCAVTAIHPVPLDVITAQIDAVLSDINIAAIKIGMLGNADIVACVAEAIKDYTGPIVVDPVMVAKSGDALLDRDAVDALRALLLPRATVLTPNIPEAAVLLGQVEKDCTQGLLEQGRALRALGPASVLIKGGHGTGPECVDWLLDETGEVALSSQRMDTQNTHGTGCSYAAATAAGLAQGQSVSGAVRAAHVWLRQAIAQADGLNIGQGHGPVHHFHGMWT